MTVALLQPRLNRRLAFHKNGYEDDGYRYKKAEPQILSKYYHVIPDIISVILRHKTYTRRGKTYSHVDEKLI